MIVHRYSTKDSAFIYTRGKTDALREARQHAKVTPKDVTLEVEAVELMPLTTKTLVLALLNGEDVVAYDEEGEPKGTPIASIKGKCRPQPKPRNVRLTLRGKPYVAPNGTKAKSTIYDDPHDAEDQEYVMVYMKKGGWRLVKLEHIKPGMKVATAPDSPRASATVGG
jgi:hypothetical protein